MACIGGFGRQKQDLEFGTLSCHGKKIIDEKCTLRIKNIIVNDIEVKGSISNGSTIFSAQMHEFIFVPSMQQTTIPYDTIITNQGFSYDSNTGVVTVLQSGIYQIIALTNFYPVSATYISSTINTSTGVQATYSSPTILDEALNSLSPCVTVSLNPGDTIYVTAYQSGLSTVPLATDAQTNITIKRC